LRQGGVNGKRQLPVEMLPAFSQASLLPRLAALLADREKNDDLKPLLATRMASF
jgi:hypothetical protein